MAPGDAPFIGFRGVTQTDHTTGLKNNHNPLSSIQHDFRGSRFKPGVVSLLYMTTARKPITDELEADWKLVRPNNTGGRGHARYLVGKHFSYLEVQARAGSDKNGTSLWQCYCHLCGQTKVVSRPALTSGRVKSCGCLKAKQSSMPKATDDPKDRRPRKSIWRRLSED